MQDRNSEKIWTILEILKWTTDYFNSKALESPRLKTELLLCSLLDLKRIEIYSNFERPLTKSELSKFRDWIQRAVKREPIQMIMGEVEFCSLRICVDNSTIVPRPETELLTEIIIRNEKGNKIQKILDIGSGTGCISLVLAKNFPDSQVTGLDISQKAVALAQKNAEINNIKNVTFKCSDVSKYSFDGTFDLIVSNPPYIEIEEYNKLEPEVRDYEPREALTDEGDGLAYYRIFANLFGRILSRDGKFYLENSWNQSDSISKIFSQAGYETKHENDFNGLMRFVIGKSHNIK